MQVSNTYRSTPRYLHIPTFIPTHSDHIPTSFHQIPTVQISNTYTYLLIYLHIMILYLHVGLKYLQLNFQIPAHTYCCMCHYPAVFLQEISAYSAPVSAPVYSAPVSAPVSVRRQCAVVSPSVHSHRRRIAVASPSHRRRIAASHRRRIASLATPGDLPTSLELHLPVVQPTRCTRTEEVGP